MPYGIRVPQDVGRKVKGLLKRRRSYEDKYLPLKERDHIVLPIRHPRLRCEHEIARITDDYHIDNFDLRENQRTRSFRRELQKILPSSLYERAARAYEQIGDIGIITVFSEMEPYQYQIAQALMETNKGIRLVLKKAGKYSGTDRLQEYEILAGSGSTETTHTENGVSITLDVMSTYFSARTANERKRIASQIRGPEHVLIPFSGCGPYALILAANTRAERIVGIEINENAHAYALRNVRANHLTNISLINGDARASMRALQQSSFDRIILPHPTEADYFLDDALRLSKDKKIVHMYLFSKPKKLDYPKGKIREAASRHSFVATRIDVVEQLHVSSEVKKYCFDIHVKRTS